MTIEKNYKVLDKNDSLAPFKKQFHFPKTKTGENFLYFCGNSLGLQSIHTEKTVIEELDKWKSLGVEGHFESNKPWLNYHQLFSKSISRLVGAKPEEVITMNSLTVNLNLLLLSFYNPTAGKYKILIEKNAFPSDHYAIQSQVDLLVKKDGFPKLLKGDVIQFFEPNDSGVYDTDSILDTIGQKDVALVLLSGVNYQTGELFDLKRISNECNEYDITLGLDLAHAIGNVPLSLHKWGVDFAVWCTYKYLNGGPGSVGGAYINEKHCKDYDLPRLHGWWSNKEENRFEMNHIIDPYETAEAWQMSNAPILSMASLLGSLQVFDSVNLDDYYKKGQELSDYLIQLVKEELPEIEIITPEDRKGCQVSLFIRGKDENFISELKENGIIADWRNHKKGGILRLAPVPLYNSFEDIFQLVIILKNIIN